MTTLRPEIAQCRVDGLAGRPDLRWTAFQYATLLLLHELREKARRAATPGTMVTGPGPEDTADELLDEISLAGAHAQVDPGLVAMVVDAVQAALYRNITVPGRWGSWTALQCAAQGAAEEVAAIVAEVADEMVEMRDNYQRTTSDEDADETVASMNRLIGMMRMAVMSVQSAGASARS